MIKNFNVNILEKESNKLTLSNYLKLKVKQNISQELLIKMKKRLEFNYNLNMKYFDSLDYSEFAEYVNNFMKRNKFVSVSDLTKYKGIPGIYIMIFDEYKQAYIGLSEHGIKERIQQHWNEKKEAERLIFGQVFNLILSVDSFGALDNTRIFVKTGCNLYKNEERLVYNFDKRFLLNRTAGGIGNIDTYTDGKIYSQVAIVSEMKVRDFTPFIDEKKLYDQCSEYDIMMYESIYKRKDIE